MLGSHFKPDKELARTKAITNKINLKKKKSKTDFFLSKITKVKNKQQSLIPKAWFGSVYAEFKRIAFTGSL